MGTVFVARCAACDAAMVHHWTRKAGRVYRYYTCSRTQKLGRTACSTGSIPAVEIEDFVAQSGRILLHSFYTGQIIVAGYIVAVLVSITLALLVTNAPMLPATSAVTSKRRY